MHDFIIAINQATNSLLQKFESCLIMAGPSTSRALTEVEQMTVLNEVLDDETLIIVLMMTVPRTMISSCTRPSVSSAAT
jgi:hypothetical protein